MRVLLAINNAYTDPWSGAARSMRTLMEWLRDAGHECTVLCTARFDGFRTTDLERHFSDIGVRPERMRPEGRGGGDRDGNWDPIRFEVGGVTATMVPVSRKSVSGQTAVELARVMRPFARLMGDFEPEILVTYGGGRLVQSFLYQGRRQGMATVFALHSHGYEDRGHFRYVDHALACSPYLGRHYRREIGLDCTGIPAPMTWRETVADSAGRACVTFVNPIPQKGLAVFARLAGMLAKKRPDIPILVVWSVADRETLATALPFDFTACPQITVADDFATPAEIFAHTRILLVPSLVREAFGRVAAEALINGVPALVSDRGALPETVGDGGIVLSVPDDLSPQTQALPSEAAVVPWYDTVTALWDDTARYDSVAARAAAEGRRLYDEPTLRDRYNRYMRSLVPGRDPFVGAPAQ